MKGVFPNEGQIILIGNACSVIISKDVTALI